MDQLLNKRKRQDNHKCEDSYYLDEDGNIKPGKTEIIKINTEAYMEASAWFEKYQDEYLRTARDVYWKIGADPENFVVLPVDSGSKWKPFWVHYPENFSGLRPAAHVLGTWYILPHFRGLRLGWLVCSRIYQYDDVFIFSTISARKILDTVNADNFEGNPGLVFGDLRGCIPIVGAKPYNLKNGVVEDARIHIGRCDQEYIERFHPHAVERIKRTRIMA